MRSPAADMPPSASVHAAEPGANSLTRVQSRRRTIAVLADYMNFFGGGYEAQLRDAFHAHCQERDLNLLLVYGRALDEPHAGCAAHNAIFDQLRPECVDGLIVISACLSAHCGRDGMLRFFERFREMPVCSVGAEIPGVPSVVIDNRPGISAVVEHLITEHRCRRLAFIAGTPQSPEAQARFDAYRDALRQHDLDYDPALVEAGHFVKNKGLDAMARILDRGVIPDGVVAANDSMALGAIEALRALGYRVPRDLPVTGFDDLVLARLGNPSLTTVAQPFERMSELAIDLVLARAAGKEIPACTVLPAEFVIRHSCGCDPGAHPDRMAILLSPGSSLPEYLDQHAETLQSGLSAVLRVGAHPRMNDARRLLRALRADVAGQTNAFAQALEAMLDDAKDDNEHYRALQNAITFLRQELQHLSSLQLESLWSGAFSAIAMANTTAQMQHRVSLDESHLRLLNAGEQVYAAFDLASLRAALIKSLPAAGMRTAFIGRYIGSSSVELEPFVNLVDGEPVDPGTRTLTASQALTLPYYPYDNRVSFLIFPVVFEAQALGIALFEYTPDLSGWHVLRDQIGVAFRSVGLHHELVHKTMLHERSVQERLATAKRMKSLSLLAGGVAHDLNNALGPLVALPDAILHELDALPLGSGTLAELRMDAETIKSAALRAADTIKDLLTLGRQGRTQREPLEVARVVRQSVEGDVGRLIHERGRRVNIVVDLLPEPLALRGSEPHLVRALINLVRNAIEAIPENGEVVIKTSCLTLSEPITRYETIEAGEYVVISVSDTGSGIPAQDLGRVFEPYYSKKPLRDNSGSGLGLSIVHGVVKEHEGFIDVVSTVGRGTTFTLYFPRTQPKAYSARPISALPRRGAHVLLVDDDPIQLRTGRRVLTQLGYQVDTINSGRRAYELFVGAKASGRSPYDLLILDMLLNEEQDGLQIFEQIQALFPQQRAIVVSGHAPTERADLAIEKGLRWLGKPYTAEALAEAAATVLAGPTTLAVEGIAASI